jgi:hypothetical protein
MKKTLFTALFAAMLLALPTAGQAHVYDRDDSDYPLRYIAYALYPVGLAVEYAVLRPIHWVVSQPNLDKFFGHDPRREEEAGTYFEWE